MGVNSLPETVTRQRRGCDLSPGTSAPESSTLTTRLPSHPTYGPWMGKNVRLVSRCGYVSLLLCDSVDTCHTERFSDESPPMISAMKIYDCRYVTYSLTLPRFKPSNQGVPPSYVKAHVGNSRLRATLE